MIKRKISLKTFAVSGFTAALFLALILIAGCGGSSNNEGGAIPLTDTDFKYTISNHTGYDIVVRHVNRDRYDWSGGRSPQENFNNVKIPSRETATRNETSAKYRSDSGREDIYLDVYNRIDNSYQFTSSISNFYVARMACHNSNYVQKVSFSDPRLRTVWVRATGESFLNIYPGGISPSDWMEGLRGNNRIQTIADLAIPGTHDSGAFDSTRACECQSDSPIQQLESGVRSFDFRVACVEDTLYLVHGNLIWFGCTFNFKHVLKDYLRGFRDFLAEHPAEFILLHIKKESDSTVPCPKETGLELKDALGEAEAGGLQIMKDYDRFPTLEEAAGKLLLWYEPNVSSCCSYPVKIDWRSETRREEVPWGGSGAKFIIQDAYKNSSSDKWDIVRNLLIEASQHTDPQALYYSYTSCVAGGSPNPAGEAENINEWFATWMSRNPDSGPLGCVIMDYINCASFSGTGVTWYCSSGGHDLLPFMIYASNY
jgi:hypothetical protein